MEKMSWISRRLKESPDPAPLREAQRHLYAAQTSHAQGRRAPEGFPLQRSRRETSSHLLRAERVLDLAGGTRVKPAAGYPPGGGFLMVSGDLTLLIDPHRGGRIVELGDKVSARNLVDGRGGAALTDRLLPEDTSFGGFLADKTREIGGFSRGRYEWKLSRSRSSVRAVLTRAASLPGGGSITCSKTVTIPSSGRVVRVSQKLSVSSSRRRDFLFVTELNLALKDAHVNRSGEAAGVRRFAVVDPAAGLQVSWLLGRSARLWHFPLETGAGFRRVYRGVRLAWAWPVTLGPRRSWETEWKMTIGAPDGVLPA